MENGLSVPANEMDHYRGDLHSEVVLVQYGDYQCPYSSLLARDIDQLMDEYKGVLCHVYRHYPQSGIHELAEITALASEAAAEQDAFWNLHQLLFHNTEDLSPDLIRMLVRKAGLDMNQFESDMRRFDLFDKVRTDVRNGMEAGIRATPTLFINGMMYNDSSSYWPLKEAIELASGNSRSASI